MTKRQFDEGLIAEIEKHKIPGLAIGIMERGEIVYAKGFGMADISRAVPVTADTVFRIGSISKTFTAIGLMQLWEQSLFFLDEPVNHYLKGFQITSPDFAPPVTFRHLLTHTSGLGMLRRFSDILKHPIHAGLSAKEGTSPPSLNQYYAGGIKTKIPPGTKWAYSNHGFAVIGQLVEDISGLSFAMYMRERVFKPLGMFHSDYRRDEVSQQQTARGYKCRWGRQVPVKHIEIMLPPSGSIFSSVNEMFKYMAALTGGGFNKFGAVLKPETLNMMTTPQYRADDRIPAGMGLGFMVESIGKHRIAWHNGGLPGFSSSMHIAPDDGLGVVVLMNTMKFGLADKLSFGLIKQLLKLSDGLSQLEVLRVAESPEVWHELCGFYAPGKSFFKAPVAWLVVGGGMKVFTQDNHLMFAERLPSKGAKAGVRLFPINAADPYVFGYARDENIEYICFKRNEYDQVDRLCMSMDITLHKSSR